jgi:exosortase
MKETVTTVGGEHATALQPARDWTRLAQAAILVALLAFLYTHILGRLVTQWWDDPNWSHGFFVPLFAAYVLWRERDRLQAIPSRPSWFGLVIVAGALAVLIVGVLGAELFLSRSSLIFLLAGLAVLFRGWRFFRATLFPWAVLFLAVPIPAIVLTHITLPLQFLASNLASSLLGFVGVPVLREGNVIQLSTMSLEVAQACSGIRSLVSLGTLAVIYGYFLEPSRLGRVLLILAAIPIAVLANGLRIMGTGLTGLYWSPDKAQGFFHEFSGWVIFILSLAMLLALHSLSRWLVRRLRAGRKRS